NPRTLRVLLGAGQDTADVLLASTGASNGPSQVIVDGGVDNDQIAVDVTVPHGGSGAWDVQVLGRTGDDVLKLFVHGNPQDLAKSTFLSDGGPGIDEYFASDFVRVLNCEKQGR